MRVLALGWGVQSFTLAAMVALGELEHIDAAIHADTLHESQLTYEFARRWTPWLQEHNVNVVTVSDPQQAETGFFISKMLIPVFTLKGQIRGQVWRKCTHRWKVAPIRRWLQANRSRKPVEQWLGISLDEALRMTPSRVKYITLRWPLIEKRMTRRDCVTWLIQHSLEVPWKSACTFCPYHSTQEWRRVRSVPADWGEAVNVDRALRNAKPPYLSFVHPSRRPLEEINLLASSKKGQLRLWDEECTGLCGL